MKTSNLYQAISKLSQNSIESVQTGNGFSPIDEYLNTERPITDELLTRMVEIDDAGGGIIFLVGSAGDGKSHLLSRVKEVVTEWGENSFYNDATASYSPNKTAIETLTEGLKEFSDENIQSTRHKKVIAINLGKLNAFIDNPDIRKIYEKIAIACDPLFDYDGSTSPINSEKIKIVEFSNKQIFELIPEKQGIEALESMFLTTILDKLVAQSENGISNPFYDAYLADQENDSYKKSPIHLNYQLLMIPEVRRTIVLTVIEAIIRFKLIVTPREYLDFIYSILVYNDINRYKEKNDFYEALLPSLIYAGGHNVILNAISRLDPMKQSSTEHDRNLSLLFTSNSIPHNFIPEIGANSTLPEYIIHRTNRFYENNGRDVERTTKFLFRLVHLLKYHSECDTYISFLNVLTGVFSGDDTQLMCAYDLVTKGISRHNGSFCHRQDLIPLNIQGGKYKLFARLSMEPDQPLYKFSSEKPWEFYPEFKLIWQLSNCSQSVDLVIDYSLYSYLYDLNNGKLAIAYENEKNIRFSHFIQTLADLSDCRKTLTVVKLDSPDMVLRQTLNNVQLR